MKELFNQNKQFIWIENFVIKLKKEYLWIFIVTCFIPLILVNCASKKQLALPCATKNVKSSERIIPEKPDVNELIVKFQGDYLKAYYLFLDIRTPFEKKRDLKNGKLNGSVLLYLQAHSLRADTAYDLVSRLALRSKSGIVVVPVCDTPFGKDPRLSW